MRLGFVALLTAVAGFLLPLAHSHSHSHAQNNAAATPAAQVTMATGASRGALYRIQHRGKASYLFGTIHVGTPDFISLGAEVAQALKLSGNLVLELDVRNDLPLQDALQKHGIYPDGESIDRAIASETLAMLQQSLDAFDLTLANVRHMKPWLLANLLLGLDLDRNGYRRQHGAEYLLLAAAPGKTVMQLETAEYQMSLFDSMSAALQEEYLREALAELGDGNALKKARALIDAWATADRKRLEEIWSESLAEQSTAAEFTHRVLLEQRNPEMANKVEALLRDDVGSFVGVGLLHLVGKTGLPAILRERGYVVEKVH